MSSWMLNPGCRALQSCRLARRIRWRRRIVPLRTLLRSHRGHEGVVDGSVCKRLQTLVDVLEKDLTRAAGRYRPGRPLCDYWQLAALTFLVTGASQLAPTPLLKHLTLDLSQSPQTGSTRLDQPRLNPRYQLYAMTLMKLIISINFTTDPAETLSRAWNAAESFGFVQIHAFHLRIETPINHMSGAYLLLGR